MPDGQYQSCRAYLAVSSVLPDRDADSPRGYIQILRYMPLPDQARAAAHQVLQQWLLLAGYLEVKHLAG